LGDLKKSVLRHSRPKAQTASLNHSSLESSFPDHHLLDIIQAESFPQLFQHEADFDSWQPGIDHFDGPSQTQWKSDLESLTFGTTGEVQPGLFHLIQAREEQRNHYSSGIVEQTTSNLDLHIPTLAPASPTIVEGCSVGAKENWAPQTKHTANILPEVDVKLVPDPPNSSTSLLIPPKQTEMVSNLSPSDPSSQRTPATAPVNNSKPITLQMHRTSPPSCISPGNGLQTTGTMELSSVMQIIKDVEAMENGREASPLPPWLDMSPKDEDEMDVKEDFILPLPAAPRLHSNKDDEIDIDDWIMDELEDFNMEVDSPPLFAISTPVKFFPSLIWPTTVMESGIYKPLKPAPSPPVSTSSASVLLPDITVPASQIHSEPHKPEQHLPSESTPQLELVTARTEIASSLDTRSSLSRSSSGWMQHIAPCRTPMVMWPRPP
jgi:hypothetical protein